MKLSVVIPTYKRPESLIRLVHSLDNQSLIPDEILIISGDIDSIDEADIIERAGSLNISFFYSKPSVCVQRNIGIREAKGDYICLLDDDTEPELNYLKTIVEFLDANPESAVACGLFLEFRNNEWTAEFPPKSVLSLCYKRLFHHAVWGNVNNLHGNFITQKIYSRLQNYYSSRGNGLTDAGWPLVTDLSQEVNACQVYTLGASIFRSALIKAHIFDEILEPSGIGDNYGVSLSLLQVKPISVLKSTYIHHYRADENRMKKSKSYGLRILAMQYFLKINKKMTKRTNLLLLWSIFGNLIAQLLKLEITMAWASIRVFLTILFDINPYTRSIKNARTHF